MPTTFDPYSPRPEPSRRPEALEAIGAYCLPGLLDRAMLSELESLFDALPAAVPGARPSAASAAAMAAVEAVRAIVALWIGAAARPVRVLVLDKRDGANWALGWHQDRTIVVRERRVVEGFGAWTLKAGKHHASPPIAILDAMATARLHLDDVDEENAPLMVAPGSHRLGVVPEHAVANVVADRGIDHCLAQRGDVWFYATPILHASARTGPGRRRRVVQIDFAAANLPRGLEWTT